MKIIAVKNRQTQQQNDGEKNQRDINHVNKHIWDTHCLYAQFAYPHRSNQYIGKRITLSIQLRTSLVRKT